MDEFDFACPDCGVELSVEASDIGDALDCPSCGNVLQLDWSGAPAAGAASASAPASDGTSTVSGAPKRPGGKKMKLRGNKKKMTMSRRPAASPSPADDDDDDDDDLDDEPAVAPTPKKRSAGGKSVVMKTRTRTSAGTPRRGGAPAVESDYGGVPDLDGPRPKSVAGIVVGIWYCFSGTMSCIGGSLVSFLGKTMSAVADGSTDNTASMFAQAGAAILWVIAIGFMLLGGFMLFMGISLIRMKNWARITAIIFSCISLVMSVLSLGLVLVNAATGSTSIGIAATKSMSGLLTMAIAAAVVFFLTRKKAKVAYGALPLEALDGQ